MKFLSTIVIAMASVAVAQDNKNMGDMNGGDMAKMGKMGKGNNTMMGMMSTKSQCRQVEKMTKLVELAANTTKLDKVTDGNATKAQEIQAKAAQAQPKLTTLQSNATLMTACNQMFAVQAEERMCGKMMGLEKLQALVMNQTALDAKTKGNTTKADMIKSMAQAKMADLTAMQGNATLTGFCAGVKDKQDCKMMAKVAKEQMFATNTTAVVSFTLSPPAYLLSSNTQPPSPPCQSVRLSHSVYSSTS
jgi:hypothetical protein